MGPRIRGPWYAMRLALRKWAREGNVQSGGLKRKRPVDGCIFLALIADIYNCLQGFYLFKT
jgi:hypothetical protein